MKNLLKELTYEELLEELARRIEQEKAAKEKTPFRVNENGGRFRVRSSKAFCGVQKDIVSFKNKDRAEMVAGRLNSIWPK